jgi:hypothetical protein
MQRWLLTGFLLVATPFGLLYSQTNTLGQFWNELSFSRAAFKKVRWNWISVSHGRERLIIKACLLRMRRSM